MKKKNILSGMIIKIRAEKKSEKKKTNTSGKIFVKHTFINNCRNERRYKYQEKKKH